MFEDDFIFEVGIERYSLAGRRKHLDARDIPHVWANTAPNYGKLIVACQPGGFEKFLDELGKLPDEQANEVQIKQVMAKYGMEYLGPPLLRLWRQQQH